MEEKNVSFIRSLVSTSGGLAGSAMPKNAVVKLAEEPQKCATCGGTGWKDVVSRSERRVKRCSSLVSTDGGHLLVASEIPARYADCEFSNYQTRASEEIATAKITRTSWTAHFPLDRSGV